MQVKYLKELIKDLPDDMEVLYDDPNFSGPYHTGPEEYDIKVENGKLLIGFPFESSVD
jgi:hypothetical protein